MQWLIFAVGLIMLTILVRVLTRLNRRGEAEQTQTKNPYHCVAVEHGWHACNTAQRLGETRFLSKEAPPLPLPGCSLRPCQCRYKHFDDRRAEERRSPFMRGNIPATVGGDRRGPDRRSKPHYYRVTI
jgi:hypothetical protein